MADEPSAGAGSSWKPRFPVARIKKIMQADEDVGKVAQVTPVAISKALEIFIDRIIRAVAEETRSRGVRKVTPGHFKAVITHQGQYDFLEGLTAEVAMPPQRPASPPQRRRRRASGEEEVGVKRKRRNRVKEEAMEEEVEEKEELEVKEERVEEGVGDHRRGGWFDIVMGGHAESESEDDSQQKRKYRYMALNQRSSTAVWTLRHFIAANLVD
jgi:hypothetical protein